MGAFQHWFPDSGSRTMTPESVRFSTVEDTGTGIHPLKDSEFNPT